MIELNEKLRDAKTQYLNLVRQLKFNRNELAISIIVQYICSEHEYNAYNKYIQRVPPHKIAAVAKIVYAKTPIGLIKN